MKVLVINGPNMQLLHQREGYGGQSLQALEKNLQQCANGLGVQVEFFASDIEGEIVKKIGCFAGDGIVINPAAYSHYSLAILDALQIFGGIKVEVHITNLYKREQERQKSLTAQGCEGVISGLGVDGYLLALQYIVAKVKGKERGK
ncbi:MAG: 3-dehydroquinate dehydratase [Firmicutes bacterium]|nr:3-dehydroquinate dehydratase [Bacillota bacterium]